jgi:predicted glycosyltransferase
MTNAPVAGLTPEELDLFDRIDIHERADMAHFLRQAVDLPVIVDTAVIPGIEKHAGPLCLLLRETVPWRVKEFNLANGRAWDFICVPNPVYHWMPQSGSIRAKTIKATGWIVRSNPQSPSLFAARKQPRLLVASGGGGNAETAQWFRSTVDQVIAAAKVKCNVEFHVAQAVGPRQDQHSHLATADEFINAGARLNELFDTYDAVISTAGYNSVLELAELDVPVLLVPISRSLDDQGLRARQWATRMGHAHEDAEPEVSATWLAETLASRKRRTAVSLDPKGAENCARLIAGVMK